MKTVQVTLTRTYFKQITINVEVEDSLVGKKLIDFLTNDEVIDNRLEEGLAEASLDACDKDKYTFLTNRITMEDIYKNPQTK